MTLASFFYFILCTPVMLATSGAFPRRAMVIVQELCESRGGGPGLSVLTSLLVSVDVKLY